MASIHNDYTTFQLRVVIGKFLFVFSKGAAGIGQLMGSTMWPLVPAATSSIPITNTASYGMPGYSTPELLVGSRAPRCQRLSMG